MSKKAATDEIIIAALICSPTIRAAAEAAEVAESTIYNKLKQEDFKKAYAEAKSEIMKQTTTYLQGTASEAVKELVNIIQDDFTFSAQERINACKAILEYTLKFTESNDLLKRIEKLTDKET